MSKHEEDALESYVQFKEEGHAAFDGEVCSDTCDVCNRNPTDPDTEYQKIIQRIIDKLDGKEVHLDINVPRQALHALSRHPRTITLTGLPVPVIVEVYVEFNGSTAIVRSLLPIQGKKEAYTKDNVPPKPPWNESTSEGLDPTVEGKND